MKLKHISLIVLGLILITGIAFCVESQSDDNRPVIGIALDTSPLPALLNKHLGLKTGQGLRIANIMKGSGAEEQGLEVDDIVIKFQGKDLYNRETLSNEVSQAGVGEEVSMEVIHLGQHKTVTLKLKALKDTTGWKYQNEPQIENERFFQPGSVYSFEPDKGWMQIPEDQIPDNIKSNIFSIFNELYSSTFNINGKQYTVTIKGNPEDKDSEITVKIDKDEFPTTIGEIDKMPDDYQEAAKKAIENAKTKSMNRFPSLSFDFGDSFMPHMFPDNPQIQAPNSYNSLIFQRMEEQMKQMQEQFRQLEESHQKLLESLNKDQQ